ncbi:MAG TPA: hypothetical protein VJ023_13035 [Pyrinomonadaceae bacterium]|nr:hypothetical protein [Pyrinomonadaceae bacterium]
MIIGFSSSLPPRSIALAILILLASVQIVLAQSDGGVIGGSRPNTPAGTNPIRQPSIRERQMIMDEMRREAAKPRVEEKDRLALANIKEDFTRLQEVNNRMLAENIPLTVPNFTDVIQSLDEIRKRAVRLRENLYLPKISSDEKSKAPPKIADASALKTALLMLDERIMSFIENPIFQKPGVVDVKQASQAQSDLDSIVELSRKIAKDTERLKKSYFNQ